MSAGNIVTSKILEEVRVKNNKVPWHKLICFALHIPKHSMIAWMAVLNRLPTKDKLSSQGLNVDTVCLLCNRADESRDHMFLFIYYYCDYSKKIWGYWLLETRAFMGYYAI